MGNKRSLRIKEENKMPIVVLFASLTIIALVFIYVLTNSNG